MQTEKRKVMGTVCKFFFEFVLNETDSEDDEDDKIYDFAECIVPNMSDKQTVANRFSVTKSTCWSALNRTCRLLLQVNEQFHIISWPRNQRALEIIENFAARHHFPGVLGAIDGSHIPIKAPKENHVSYINRKGYHSILLQGVCAHNLLFTDVYAGEVGSLHDITIYRRSYLKRHIMNNNANSPNNSHLIGDLAYTLSTKLLVGFKDYGNLTIRQKNYNILLNKTRAVIENAFALLKGRFRRLKYLETKRIDLVVLLIISACILHNICIYSGDTIEDLLDIEAELEEERRNNPHNLRDIDNNINENDNNALAKRMDIVNSLPLIIRND